MRAVASDDARLPRRAGFVADVTKRRAVREVEARARFRTTSQLNAPDGRPKPHVAALGETLYTDHLIAVELAGALLFVALIGAVAIATPKLPVRPGATPGGAGLLS
jgi:hypothetical protein